MGAHTTGKECDGCGRRRGQVSLRVIQRKSAGATVPLTFCRRCEREDAEAHGEIPVRPAAEIVRALPPPTRVPLAIGWTTSPILPRLRRAT